MAKLTGAFIRAFVRVKRTKYVSDPVFPPDTVPFEKPLEPLEPCSKPMSLLCCICKLPITETRPRARKGRLARCIVCHGAMRSKAHALDPRRVMLMGARRRAKRRGLPCTITIEDIVIPSHCPVLGFPLIVKTGSRGHADNSPTLDAIDPSKGYVRGNVQVISHLVNAMKSKATAEQLKSFASWVMSHKNIKTRIAQPHGSRVI